MSIKLTSTNPLRVSQAGGQILTVPPSYVQVCVETMMHLTCTNMPETELENALDKV